MRRINSILLVILIFTSVLTACSAQQAQAPSAPSPTRVVEPVSTQSTENLPQTEAEVPRISVEDARAAFESGEAILVDVRSPGAFEKNHIAGAISVPLGAIERDLANITLNKTQWIITYCT